MTESQILKLIKDTVRRELAPILMATLVSNESQNRSTVQRFQTEGAISNLRNIQSYGLASRAPAGTQALTVPVDGNATHLNMVGHFDENRPTMNDGETVLYDAYGHVIYLSQSKIQFGSKASANPMVLGDILQTLMDGILDAILNAPQLVQTPLGPGWLDPSIRSQLASLQSDFVDNADTNFLSKKAFTER